jgi:SAM-dependent methyltransferase
MAMTTRTSTTYQAPTGLAAAWERLGAALYDPFLAKGERQGMARRRADLLSGARGKVLEIGAGTGLNVEHYPGTLDSLVLTEPVAPMAERLRRRAAERADLGQVEIVEAPAEVLPFPTGSFDTVVSTMVLCTVVDVGSALSEVARVLAPGGRLLFIEHVHADGTRLGRWQRRLAGPWAAYAQGCRCDRDLVGDIRSQFELIETTTAEWAGMPALVRPLVIGSATPTREARAGAWAHHVEDQISLDSVGAER